MEDINNYRIVLSNNHNAILLNKKHKVSEFQEEIEKIIEKNKDKISQFGDDWEIISENINAKFDWFELYLDEEKIYY
ncbi:MAG: hypothetical protein ACI4VQ_02375 [Clostridia bacterium]